MIGVTGANGFVGSQIVRALVERGHEVLALIGAQMDCENLQGLRVQARELELHDAASVLRALEGCRSVVHSAACYDFWRADSREFYQTNVLGTRHVLDAARVRGVDRVVYTSTAGTLSPGFGVDGTGDEENAFDLRRFRGHYKTSKAMAENLVMRAASRGLPVVILHPTTVVGPGDRRPTPTGSMIVHYLNRHMKVYVPMVQNIVDVRDVAAGHVFALEKGRLGDRYVLGGENLSMRELVGLLGEITGIPAPRLALPHALLAAAGRVNEFLADHVTHRPPLVAREAALHARDSCAFDSAKAERELGFRARPARAALIDAVRWFATTEHCPPATAERLSRLPASEGWWNPTSGISG